MLLIGMAIALSPDIHLERGMMPEKLPCSRSIGFAMKGEDSTIVSLYNEADEMLYEEKKKFYILSGNLRRRH